MGIAFIKIVLLNMVVLPSFAATLWKNDNQQAHDLFEQGHFHEAHEKFIDPVWKGVAAYREKDYVKAAQYLSQAQTVDDFYNLGNALAQMGQLEEAIKAYQKTLIMDPQHVDAAFNLQLLEQELQKQDEQSKKQEEEKRHQEEQKRKEEEKKRQEEQKKKEEQQKMQQSQAPSNQENNQQNSQEWLDFVNEDPSGLLKEKFRRDYQNSQ